MGRLVFSSTDFAVPAFGDAVQLAVDAGLTAAAVIDAKGKVLAAAGTLDEDEARAMAAYATHDHRMPDLLDQMREGEMVKAPFGEHDVRIGIVSNCVLFLVVLPGDPAAVNWAAVNELRADIAHALQRANTRLMPPPATSGGSRSSSPDLPVTGIRRRPGSN